MPINDIILFGVIIIIILCVSISVIDFDNPPRCAGMLLDKPIGPKPEIKFAPLDRGPIND